MGLGCSLLANLDFQQVLTMTFVEPTRSCMVANASDLRICRSSLHHPDVPSEANATSQIVGRRPRLFAHF